MLIHKQTMLHNNWRSADLIPRAEVGARKRGRAGAALGRLAKTLGTKHSDVIQMGTEKWVSFYEPFFDGLEGARRFVENLERINDPDLRPHKAKIMMHQTQRLVSLADEIVELRSGRQSLQLLFLMICAENVAKLFDDFDGEGKSRHYVREFFATHVAGDDR
jgi:hypothetical protein